MANRIAINRTSGCGGFLNPPTHPEHTMCIEEINGGRTVVGIYALSSVRKYPHLKRVKTEALAILDGWQAPPIDSTEVVAWVRQVLGYFRGCYRGTTEPMWNASNLVIDQKRDPLECPEDHAGVNLIREYYPDFTPTAEDFANARWGK